VTQLIRENFGVAFVSKGVGEQLRSSDITIRPFGANSLQVNSYLVLRADQSSRLINEFGRAFLRRIGPSSQVNGQTGKWSSVFDTGRQLPIRTVRSPLCATGPLFLEGITLIRVGIGLPIPAYSILFRTSCTSKQFCRRRGYVTTRTHVAKLFRRSCRAS
jgi:hypothetical protein